MKYDLLDKMTKGWFVGNFEPSIYKSKHVEVAVKKYSKGDAESRHYHRVATEITVVVAGKVLMNNKEYLANDIITVEPNESTDFLALEDAVTTVVKIPCVPNDKYFGESDD